MTQNNNIIYEEMDHRLKSLIMLCEQKNGICLSHSWKPSSKMKFKCKNGHIWAAYAYHIKSGRWCPYCSGRRKNIKDLQLIAKTRNGECLSPQYLGFHNLHEWKCKNGHAFKVRPSEIVRTKTWCQECKKNSCLLRIKEYAKSRGGECLSSYFKSSRTKLTFRCNNGHIWKSCSAPYNQSWCPICSKFSFLSEEKCRYVFEKMFSAPFNTDRSVISLELDGYNNDLKLAFEYNGPMHYQFIERFHKTQNHFKKRKRTDKIKKQLCQQTGIDLIVIPHWVNSDDKSLYNFIKNEVEKRSYCIQNNWSIKYFDTFYRNQHHHVDKMTKLAQKMNGVFISGSYRGASKLHKWKCDKGHIWESTPARIRAGSWCPHCARKNLFNMTRNKINDVIHFAKKYNGELLEENYVNNKTLMKWSCSNGHHWLATLNAMNLRVKHNKWCLLCE